MSAVMRSSGAAPRPESAVQPTAPALPAEKPKSVGGAIERLALSREQLRTAMMPAPKSPTQAGGVSAMAAGLVDRVKTNPAAALFLDAVKDWWARHPLRTASRVAAEASRRFAAPVAERNPLALVFGAVLIGALLALTKPWRWMLRPALFAGLVPALAARAIRDLPVESWLKVFASMTKPGSEPAASTPPMPTRSGSPASPNPTAASVQAAPGSTTNF